MATSKRGGDFTLQTGSLGLTGSSSGPPTSSKSAAQNATGRLVTTTLSAVSDAERKSNQNPVNAPLQAAAAKLHWAGKMFGLRFLERP